MTSILVSNAQRIIQPVMLGLGSSTSAQLVDETSHQNGKEGVIRKHLTVPKESPIKPAISGRKTSQQSMKIQNSTNFLDYASVVNLQAHKNKLIQAAKPYSSGAPTLNHQNTYKTTLQINQPSLKNEGGKNRSRIENRYLVGVNSSLKRNGIEDSAALFLHEEPPIIKSTYQPSVGNKQIKVIPQKLLHQKQQSVLGEAVKQTSDGVLPALDMQSKLMRK